MMTEPGDNGGFTRLAVSLRPDDERQLTKLRHKLEASSGKRHSLAAVVRLALDCLAKEQGL